jgi:hypothetical protein
VTELVPNWKYCLLIDADVWIPPNYCGTLIKEMERNPRLVMAGAKFLETPARIEATSPTHVRSSNHVIRREFYERSKIGYNSLHGEILLERIALLLGFETRTYPLTAVEGRSTGITVGDPILKGIHEYKLGYPLLPSLIRLRTLRKEHLLELYGWIYARLRNEERYFRKEDLRILYRDYFSHLSRKALSLVIHGESN